MTERIQEFFGDYYTEPNSKAHIIHFIDRQDKPFLLLPVKRHLEPFYTDTLPNRSSTAPIGYPSTHRYDPALADANYFFPGQGFFTYYKPDKVYRRVVRALDGSGYRVYTDYYANYIETVEELPKEQYVDITRLRYPSGVPEQVMYFDLSTLPDIEKEIAK